MTVTSVHPGLLIDPIAGDISTTVEALAVGTSIAVFMGRILQGRRDHVALCLDNGDEKCCVPVAHQTFAATAVLRSETGDGVLRLIAKDGGGVGHTIGAAVSCDAAEPQAIFNLEVFRWEQVPAGQIRKRDRELWTNLSMDPRSLRNASAVVTQRSRLVDAEHAEDPGLPPTPATNRSAPSVRPGRQMVLIRRLWSPPAPEATAARTRCHGPHASIRAAALNLLATALSRERIFPSP